MSTHLHHIFTPTYKRLCIAVFLFFAGLHFLTPVVPVFLTGLGFKGAELGMLLGTFLVSSLLLRPWVGRQSDTQTIIPPKHLMMLGVVLGSVAAASYWWVATMPWLLWGVRALHGISFALFYTAATGYLVRSVPSQYKAEAISYYSNAVKFAMAFTPGIAIWVLSTGHMDWAFMATAAMTLLGVVVLAPLPLSPVPPSPSDTATQAQATPPKTVFGLLPKALPLSLIMVTQSAIFGALIPFVPLLSDERGFEHGGWFYALYALSLMATRFISGSWSDTHGRTTVLLPSMAMVSLSVFCLAWAPNDWAFLALTVCYGFAAGAVQPSIMALVSEQVDDTSQSTALATFSVFADTGIAIGNIVMASLGFYFNYGWGLVAIGVISMIGLVAMAYQATLIEPCTPAGKLLRQPAVQFRRWYRGF